MYRGSCLEISGRIKKLSLAMCACLHHEYILPVEGGGRGGGGVSDTGPK